VVVLRGGLGSGKTTFVKGLAAGLGVRELVTSPSFAIVNEYEGRIPVHHVDLYRLSSPDEVELIDLEPYLNGTGVTVIEWPERAGASLPAERFEVTIEVDEEGARTVTLDDEPRRSRRP
jgi:tRNA threonylcarbamoyladenosine biosynthesis protein TsaE